jgi:hypothetical protein
LFVVFRIGWNVIVAAGNGAGGNMGTESSFAGLHAVISRCAGSGLVDCSSRIDGMILGSGKAATCD